MKLHPGERVGYLYLDLLDSEIWIPDGAIVIRDNKIEAVGSVDALQAQFGKDQIRWLDATGFLMIPGLVNAHSHVSMGFLRSLGLTQSNLIRDLMFATEKELTHVLTEKLAYSSLIDGIKSGVTTFFDHYYFFKGLAQAFDRVGARAWVGETIGDIGTAFPDYRRWENNKNQIENWEFSDCIQPYVAPHAADTVSKDLLTEMAQYAQKNNLPLHMHLSQTKQEHDFALKEFNQSPVEFAESCGALGERTLLVHMVYVNSKDIEILKKTNSSIGFCPTAQYIYEKLAPIDEYYKNDISVCLGTDCAVTNDRMDMIQEMKTAFLALLDRGIREPSLTSQKVFRMATTATQKIFNDDKKSSLQRGAKADLVFLEKDITTLPIQEARESLILSFGRSQVKHVLIDGRFVLWNQSLTLVSEDELKLEYVDAVKNIWKKQDSKMRRIE